MKGGSEGGLMIEAATGAMNPIPSNISDNLRITRWQWLEKRKSKKKLMKRGTPSKKGF